MKTVKALVDFSRPHTVIGSVVSIITLYVMICRNQLADHFPLLLIALFIGVSNNIFIVGINQIADVEIDRINKPQLPIPAGALSLKQANIIIYASLILSLMLALYISIYLFFIIVVASIVGWAYSMPPLHLKKHHITSALALSFVRGVLLNIGGFMVFNFIINKSIQLTDDVKILSGFIIVFCIAISWFKDIPDVQGDSVYNIKTLAIVFSQRRTFLAGNFLVILIYLLTILMKYSDLNSSASSQTKVLFFGHIFLLALFVMSSYFTDLRNANSVKKFYKRFWRFFFAEYLLYLVAYV